MTKKEINKKFDEIVDFADIGDFLEAPVSTYSSGMTVRLGFSIAVHCEPDILLVDEVLAVGDLSFRNKSMRKMNDLRKKSKALLFVSHNLEQIRILCDRVIIMDQGQITFNGQTNEGLIKYENESKSHRVASVNANYNKNGLFRIRHVDGDRVLFDDLRVINSKGNSVSAVGINEELKVYLDFTINEQCKELIFAISILNEKKDTDCLWVKSNDNDRFLFKNIKSGKYRSMVTFKKHHLASGVYFINYAIRNGETGETYDHGFTDVSFAVKSNKHFERGIVFADDHWELAEIEN